MLRTLRGDHDSPEEPTATKKAQDFITVLRCFLPSRVLPIIGEMKEGNGVTHFTHSGLC